jgi:1-acyl-sn-glycerol-3-phosphate acyltransferase
MLRFLLLNTLIAVITILFSVWSIFLALFDKKGTIIHRYGATPWAKVVLWICGVKLETEGLENVEPSLPRIYMSNHQSYFDIFAVLAGLPVNFKFILKQELMKIPILGPAIRRAGYIGIDRSEPKKALRSMNEAANRIKSGVSVLIFPEGTRSDNGDVQLFKKGGFHLAIKSGCDIVPVAIINSRNIVPKGSRKINRGSIIMNIGQAISIKKYPKRQIDRLIEETRKKIIEQMATKVDKEELCIP